MATIEATDQCEIDIHKSLDIEKACAWLRKEFDYAESEYVDRKCKELKKFMEK